MTARYGLPPWTGPDSPQTPVRVIVACPECCGDTTHEGADGYWCSACRQSWSFAQVAIYETGDRPDD